MNHIPKQPSRKLEISLTLSSIAIGIVWLITGNPAYEPLTFLLTMIAALLGSRSQS